MPRPRNLRDFVCGYLSAALFAEIARGVPEDPEDGSFDTSFESYGFDVDGIAPKERLKAIRDCRDFFIMENTRLAMTSGSWEQHGHDFWLTRNRHGAGFWDRGYGTIGQKLTDSAHAYGSLDLYVGDDGQIYGF